MSDITDMKEVADKMMTNLQAIQEANLEIKTVQDGAKTEVKSMGEMIGVQQKALEDLQLKYEASEKAAARKSDLAAGQSTEALEVSRKNIEEFNAVRVQNGKREVTLDEAKSLSEAQKLYFQKGHLDAHTPETKALMNTIISSDGGFIVAPEFSQTVINKRFAQHGIMSMVNVKNIAGNSFTVPVDYADYDNAEYLNELANPSGVHVPDYKSVTFNPTQQLYTFEISRDLAEDAMFNVESDVLSKGREGAGRQSAVQVVIGDGADRPKGLLNYIDSSNGVTAYNKIESLESSASLSVTWKDVLGILPSALIEGYTESYAMRKATFFNSLLTDLDGASQYAIMNQINFFSGEGVSLSILGAPVKFDIALGDASVADSYAVLYGDFKEAYTFTQRVGFSLIVDNVTSGTFITYILRRRNDGRLVLGDALKALKIKA